MCTCSHASPVLNFDWQSTQITTASNTHTHTNRQKNTRQGDTHAVETHTLSLSITHTHSGGEGGQEGGLAASTELVTGSKQQHRVAPSATPSVHPGSPPRRGSGLVRLRTRCALPLLHRLPPARHDSSAKWIPECASGRFRLSHETHLTD